VSSDENRFEFVLLDASADARRFVELCSHAADLVEAQDALELALRTMADPDSPLKDVERSLVANAATAYCRTFFDSKVREKMTALVKIPEEHCTTHELVAAYRNRTIAHSQSDLSVTYAVGVLDADSLNPLFVAGLSVVSPMPPESFLDLVEAVIERLDDVIDPVRERLAAELAGSDRVAMLARTRALAGRPLWAADFEARTARPGYPTSHPVYVSVVPDA